MKILTIRGKNLASLEEEFEIDFTAEPLKSTGIFAITGPTGAGKSTILDALCLALFDEAPRLNKAETSVVVVDVDNKTIAQKDSRNILRRGAAEGYAEVEFIALNGEKYRSRWTVKRARGKAAGALQATGMKLENLSTNTEEQGTRKEILNRITEIIGLTFDQFTRAVLLAQGDFATFLKARQSEKAELLEKLTGTEVYSHISALIYQKTAEARNNLELLRHRMADIKLLTDAELEAHTAEKETLTASIGALKLLQATTGRKLEWMVQHERLAKEIKQAEVHLADVRTKINEAAPRYEYLAMADTAQEIRDSHTELTNKRKHSQSIANLLKTKEEELKKHSYTFADAEAQLKTAEALLKETEQQHSALMPEIQKARELDQQLFSAKEKATAARQDVTKLRQQLEASAKNLATLKLQHAKGIAAKEKLQNWLKTNEIYKDIVARHDLIISLINDARIIAEQQNNAEKSLAASRKALLARQKQQTLLSEEAEHLNSLLPTEVLNLRRKLEPEKPCPVCGSTHHPLRTALRTTLPTEAGINETGINEEELEKAKEKLAEKITKAATEVETMQRGITVFETQIKNYQTQYATTMNNLKTMLQHLPQWPEAFKEGTLQQLLTNLHTQWTEAQTNLVKCDQYMENTELKTSIEQKNADNLTQELKTKTTVSEQLEKACQELTTARAALLAGKSANETEEHFTLLRKQHTQNQNALRQAVEKSQKEKATIAGVMERLREDAQNTHTQIAQLEETVAHWFEKETHNITPNQLEELLKKSAEWIKEERKFLTEIKDRELVLNATLQEKVKRLNAHLESADRPASEAETAEQLSALLKETADKQSTDEKKLTTTEVALATHRAGVEKTKAIETELNAKEELHTNWAKLNELLGSAKGDKFKTIAQGYTLDVLLTYANKHLTELTGRYKLEKIAGTLALQVIDNDMLGEVRSVHSLSGGESFLISLALALGLSALSSNRMKIESLFIDEGFGALDMDTLNVAMDALDNLQTQGRKIGVISHVEDMKERINVQIQVVKQSNGRSHVQVVG